MGFGSTAKKLQKVADMADDLYTKVSELTRQIQTLQETVEDTNDGVDDIDRELAEQRALLEAIADEQDIDTDAVIEAAVDSEVPAETTDGEAAADGS